MTDADFLRQEIIPFFWVSSRVADQQKADRLESIADRLESLAVKLDGGIVVSVEDARKLEEAADGQIIAAQVLELGADAIAEFTAVRDRLRTALKENDREA